MTPNDYQALAMRTKCDQIEALYRISNKENHTPGVSLIQLNHAALGLAGDAGELCNAVARCVYYGKELDLTNVKEEIGDSLWWLAEACDAIGVTLEEMMEANVRKLCIRYPDKYSNLNAAEENRNREAERKAVEGMWEPEPQKVFDPKSLLPVIDEFTGLPKPDKTEYLCPECGARISKRVREIVNNWKLQDYRQGSVAACPCPDCGKPLTDLRVIN